MNQKFTGKERDAESGLDYFGARYYGSALGRFTSPDWSAKPEPVPYADFSNPQTLNQYSYVLSNPLARADSDGHCDWCQKLLNGLSGSGLKTDAQLQPPPPPRPPAPKPPSPQQVPGAAPTATAPGPKYPTAEAASVTTLRQINPQSIREDREYGSQGYRNADGSYGAVPPVPLGRAGGNLPDVPDGTAPVTLIHTHGGADPGFDNEHFSPTDRRTSRRTGETSYLATPANSIQKFDPSTNRTTVIQPAQ